MIKWIHHLLEPHCLHCREEAEDKNVCKSCETLKAQLEIANFEKRQLMDAVLKMGNPQPIISTPETIAPEALRPRTIPWAVRKQMLEAEDRKQAALMKAAVGERGASGGLKAEVNSESQAKSINKLEAELGIGKEGVS